MPKTDLDEELADGLSAAKKTPRNFALIVKGPNPVKLMVRKKKFRDAELMKAKTENKGDDFITGVLEASGSDFVFKVAGRDEEPGVKTLKLKELIAEQADMTAKPRWELVKALPDIDDKDSQEKESQDKAPAEQRKKELADALKALATLMQQLMVREPGHRDNILTAAGRVKAALAENNLDEAQAALAGLKELLAEVGKGKAAAPAAGSNVSLVKLGKARLEWIGVRDAAVTGIDGLKTAIMSEFRDDAEQAGALQEALARLDRVMNKLTVRLPEELDAVLNASDGERVGLIGAARKTLDTLDELCKDDPIVAELDDNEVIQGFKVVAPMRAKLAEIAAALG
jgi:hypothetical protein